ncbi:MAG: glycosyltransferase [Pseudomonadota bacterium]
MTDHPFVSVIIPTYRDSSSLQKCLDALRSQSLPVHQFEVIVVNNDSTVSELSVTIPKNARVVHEHKPGSYSARNAGIGLARGEVLAFTDSDCIPSPSWIENATAHLQKGYDRISGHVEVFSENERRTLSEAYELVFAFDQEKNANAGTSVTANLVCWRYCFDQTGLFNAELFSGGDTEWSDRATKAGLSIKYAVDAIVYHPARASFGDIFRKRRRLAGGYSVNSKYRNSRFPFLRGLMPPVSAFSFIVSSSRISRTEKMALIPISYMFKIYSTLAMIATQRGWLKPTRK